MASFRATAALLAATSLVVQVQAWVPELPPCTSTFQPFVYSGCYKESTGHDTLGFRSQLSTDTMTIETCTSNCKGNGFRFAGLEYGGICFCGQTVDGDKADEGDCTAPCNGNTTQTCGGDNRLSIYQDPTFPTPQPGMTADYHLVGCWTDDSSIGKALGYRQDAVVGANMTTETCLTACQNGGFPYGGTEYGGECYCGVVIGNGTASAPASECNMPCNGNSSQTCGGSARLSLYVSHDLMSLEPCGYVPPSSSSTTAVVSSTSSTSSSSTSSSSTSTTSSTSSTSTSSSKTSTKSSTSTICTTSSSTKATTSTKSSTSTKCTTSSTSTTSSKTSTKTSTSTKCTTSSTSTTSSKTSTKTSTSTKCTTSSSTKATTSTKTSTSTKCTTSSSTKATTAPITSTTKTSTKATTSTSTTSSICTTTTVTPPTCEYKCGKWCSSPLPDWKDTPGCSAGQSSCALQVSACFKNAGWPDAMNCFDFSGWCKNIEGYCKAGGRSRSDCFSKNPPKGGGNPTTSTITIPCKSTPTPTPTSSTKCPIPTPTGICTQPSNSKWGYSPGNPVGGIALPALTCNDLKSDFNSYPFKLYTDADSKKCSGWSRGNVPNACAAACKAQYDQCVATYVEGCKSNDPKSSGGLLGWLSSLFKWKRDLTSYFEYNQASEARKRTISWSDTSSTANSKCTQQYNDCISANRYNNGGGKCGSWNSGW